MNDPMDMSDVFSRIWTAFDDAHTLPACAWCGRVRIDDAWVVPSLGVLAAIDKRYLFSHSICPGCVATLAAATAH